MSIKNREFSYLRTYKEPLNCPRPSTSVENALQISSLMQNKPNSPIVQMNVNNLTTMNYTIFTSLTKVKNKPNSNPITEDSRIIRKTISLVAGLIAESCCMTRFGCLQWTIWAKRYKWQVSRRKAIYDVL